MILALILLLLILGSGGGWYANNRWGLAYGVGGGVGTVLFILLIAYLLGMHF